jgi:post-segregation antitoxin (ccd killing protein)
VDVELNTMSDVTISIKLPEELVERARAVGLRIEEQGGLIAEAIEREIKRREAGHQLHDIAQQLRALPDSMKPTPEEIDQAVQRARAEIESERKSPKGF